MSFNYEEFAAAKRSVERLVGNIETEIGHKIEWSNEGQRRRVFGRLLARWDEKDNYSPVEGRTAIGSVIKTMKPEN